MMESMREIARIADALERIASAMEKKNTTTAEGKDVNELADLVSKKIDEVTDERYSALW